LHNFRGLAGVSKHGYIYVVLQRFGHLLVLAAMGRDYIRWIQTEARLVLVLFFIGHGADVFVRQEPVRVLAVRHRLSLENLTRLAFLGFVLFVVKQLTASLVGCS
jgi:hypothetical protein